MLSLSPSPDHSPDHIVTMAHGSKETPPEGEDQRYIDKYWNMRWCHIEPEPITPNRTEDPTAELPPCQTKDACVQADSFITMFLGDKSVGDNINRFCNMCDYVDSQSSAINDFWRYYSIKRRQALYIFNLPTQAPIQLAMVAFHDLFKDAG
ncbi:unnamed protein product [Calypogeia fissa]